jgi:hypothetical protein
MYLARKGVIGRPLCRPRLHRSRPPLTTPRSGFVQPALRSVMLFNDLHKWLIIWYFHHEQRWEATRNQTWQDKASISAMLPKLRELTRE